MWPPIVDTHGRKSSWPPPSKKHHSLISIVHGGLQLAKLKLPATKKQWSVVGIRIVQDVHRDHPGRRGVGIDVGQGLKSPPITKPKGGPVLRTRRTSSQRSRGTAPWSRSRKRTPAPASTIINLAGLQSPAWLFMINRKHEGVGKGDGRQELVVGSPGPRRPGRSRHSRRRRSTHRPCLCSLLSYPCPCPSTEHLCSHGQFLVPCTPSSGAQTCHTRRRDHLSQADTQRIVAKREYPRACRALETASLCLMPLQRLQSLPPRPQEGLSPARWAKKQHQDRQDDRARSGHMPSLRSAVFPPSRMDLQSVGILGFWVSFPGPIVPGLGIAVVK